MASISSASLFTYLSYYLISKKIENFEEGLNLFEMPLCDYINVRLESCPFRSRNVQTPVKLRPIR